jgi:hypothetical protein
LLMREAIDASPAGFFDFGARILRCARAIAGGVGVRAPPPTGRG